MDTMNYIQISGRLTADVTPNENKTFARFSLAKNFNGSDRKAIFFGCVIYKKEFEKNQQTIPWDLLVKGQEVLVTGRIAPNVWKDKNGHEHTDIELVLSKIRDTAQ